MTVPRTRPSAIAPWATPWQTETATLGCEYDFSFSSDGLIVTGPAHPSSVGELAQLVDQVLGPTPWHDVPQQTIDDFARVSGDDQWIHVDPERAAAGPFGTTIAHGLYTLSLGPALLGELLDLTHFAQTINYGYDKVRFPSTLPSGSRVRMTATTRSVKDLEGSAHVVITQVFEAEGQTKPVCVAESVARVVERG